MSFFNFNADSKLDPQVKKISLSQDAKNRPPAYCLPWVEASRYSIELKSNFHYRISKQEGGLEGWIEEDPTKVPQAVIPIEVPDGVTFVPKDDQEWASRRLPLSQTPSFSSPWQEKTAHSVTLKLGICWWTPPGWGLFFTSAVHRNEEFRVVEGFVRTDLWHRDVPIVIQPLVPEISIRKYSPIVSVIAMPAEDIELVSRAGDLDAVKDVVKDISLKRVRPHIYKKRVSKNREEK